MSKLGQHEVNSDNKDTAYLATILLFNQVQHMSAGNIGGWSISECYTSTSESHYITEYSNGMMYVRAESINGNHTYSFGDVIKPVDEEV